MTGPTATSPTNRFPDYDITLSDGTDSVGIVLCNAKGEPSPQIDRVGMPNDALLASQGQSEYSNYEPGYMRVEQTDWSGGRGLNDLDKDKTRYYDGRGIYPVSDGLIVGPMAHYANGFTTENKYLLDDGVSTSGSNLFGYGTPSGYVASVAFDPGSADYSAAYVEFYVQKTGSPGDLLVYIYESSGGTPTGAALATATLTATKITDTPVEYVRLAFAVPYTLDNTKNYHIVWKTPANTGSGNIWSILCDLTGSTAYYSSDGTNWNAHSYRPYYRVYPTVTSNDLQFFEYKRGYYAVTQPDTGNSYLWMNGDRGAADSNSGALTTLIDATKSWTADEWIGAKVILIAGPGSEETQPWRTITDNDGTTLTVSPSWNITHTTSTEYVIVNTDKWSIVPYDFSAVAGTTNGDLGAYVTDVAVAGDWVYFARGDTVGVKLLRYQEYNAGGTWTRRDAAETIEGRNICAIRHPEEDTMTIYGSDHVTASGQYFARVWKAKVPLYWGALYREIGTLCTTNTPWDAVTVANVTQSTYQGLTKIDVAAAAGTGVIAADDFTPAVDITQGEYLAVVATSNLITAASDLDFSYSSTIGLGDTEIDCDFPAFAAANTWYWQLITIAPLYSATTGSNAKAVLSVGIKMATDIGAFQLLLARDIKVIRSDPEYIYLPSDANITRIIPYGGNADDPRKNPWVITENAVYEIQTQNDDIVVPIPLDEIAALRGAENGSAAGVNDVYLYFNLGRKFERYYARNMDDVGPDMDEGLPANRQGNLFYFVSYPGKVFLNIDTQSNADGGGYSSIMSLNGNAWHELYRSVTVVSGTGTRGGRIRGMGLQSIPGSQTSRLWFRENDALCWIPISLNPYVDPDYTFAYEGMIEAPWIYAGAKGVKKANKSLTLFADNYTSYTKYLLDYKLDDEADSWSIAGTITPAPVEETDFSTTAPVGYRIKYRLRIRQFMKASNIAKIKAAVLNCYGIAPIKHGYNFMVKLTEDYQGSTLERTHASGLGYAAAVETALAKLDAWAQALTPLTTNSTLSIFNNKTVLLKDPRVILLRYNADRQVEEHLIQLTVHDL